MLDKFDYAEPRCHLCDGKDFYYPDKDAPKGYIPVGRVIDKLDSLFSKNDYAEAGRLLEFWRNEAAELCDKGGELAMLSELIGFYRKQRERDKGLCAVSDALLLTEQLGQSDMASGATLFINCATLYKEFDMAKEALPLYVRAEEVYKKVLMPNDSRFGGLYNNMALTLCSLERYEEAESAYFSALEIMSKAESGEAESAITYINMAHMYDSLEKTDVAAECMRIAHSLLKNDNIKRNGAFAFVLEKCAPSFGYFGDEETEREMTKEAKRIYEGA